MGYFESRNAKLGLPSPGEALPGRSARMPVPRSTSSTASRWSAFARARSRRCSGWAASGAPSASSGSCRASTRTAVGYAGGFTPNPTYREVCSGRTGHTEVVLVVFDPKVSQLRDAAADFWENHDPTQGMRQGNDAGTQYRSRHLHLRRRAAAAAEASRAAYQRRSTAAGYGAITTEIARGAASSSTPRTTTSSTWPRIPTGTAASAAPA